jgi:hypothetical protein
MGVCVSHLLHVGFVSTGFAGIDRPSKRPLVRLLATARGGSVSFVSVSSSAGFGVAREEEIVFFFFYIYPRPGDYRQN